MAREVETKIVFTTDESQKGKAIKAYNDLKKAQSDFVKQEKAGGASNKELVKGIDVFNKKLREQEKIIKVLDPKWSKVGKSVKKVKDGIKDAIPVVSTLEQEIKQLNDAFDETSKKVGSFGDIQSNLGASGALLGAVGLGGAESALTLGGEGSALLEELPRLKDAFKAAGPAIQVTAESLGLAGTAGQFASLGLGATAASLAAIALPLVLVAGAALAVAAALKQFNAGAEKQNELLLAQIDAQRAVNSAIAEGLTSEDAQSRLDELQKQREQEVVLLNQQTDAYSSMEDQLGILTGVVKVFDSREQTLADSIDATSENIVGMDAEIRQLENALGNGALAANDNSLALEGLNEERQTAIEETDRLAATLGQFEERRSQLAETRAISERNALENETLAAKFAHEDDLAEEKEHFSNLADIASEGRDKIAAINTELSALPQDRLNKLGDVESKGNDKLGKLRSDFFEKSKDKLADFQKATAKVESAGAKKRLRANIDAQDALNDAEIANDVLGFLKAQRENEKQLQRGLEDEQTAEQERVQGFIDAQAREREAFQAKQADIQAAIQLEREAVNASFTERREKLLEAIDLERAANEAQIESENARFQEQEAQQDQQADRQAQRDALRDTQQERAHQRQLSQIQEQENLASQAHQQSLARIQEIDRAIQSIQPPPAAASGGSGFSRTSGSASRGGIFGAAIDTASRFGQRSANTGSAGRGITPFHGGGEVGFSGGQKEGFIFAQSGEIVTTPDKIGSPLPFPNNQGSSVTANGASARPQVVFAPTIQSTVGEIASISDITRANEDLMMEFGRQFVGMIEGSTVTP